VEQARPEPKRLGDLIAQVMRSASMPRKGELGDLAEAWGRAAGSEVARRSHPVGLRGGELTVTFESPALRHEVESFRQAEILARLKTEFPGRRIASLRCILR
jgi:predicted nucleic acid-binding Zn ribbon protein